MAQAACARQRRSETLPLRILPLSRFPALSKLPGHKQAQEARCPEDGNWFMFIPISASIPQAVTRSTPGMVHNRVTLSSKRAHALIDLLLDLTPFRFREAQVLEKLSEQKSMMLGHTTFERQLQFRDLVPQFPLGHLCQSGRVSLPSEHRFQHRSPGSTQSIGRYRCQFNVGILQHLLNSIRDAV